MEMGLRIAGTTEFAGLDRPPTPGRVRVLRSHAKRMFPGLRTEQSSEWMGQRPSTPDYLPVVSASSRYRNVFYAFGHGHLGVVSAAPTARLARRARRRTTGPGSAAGSLPPPRTR